VPIKSQLENIWDYSPNLTPNHFLEHIPADWIESALTLTHQTSIRRRRLPADMVLWLVIGMAFFRNEPIDEVARRLNICAEGLANEVLLAKSGISKARERLGEQPMACCFSSALPSGVQSVTPMIAGMDCKSLLSMVHCSAHRKAKPCVRILVRATPPVIVKHLTRWCAW
jgi:hypothetical protein